jgi:hypothetical protein
VSLEMELGGILLGTTALALSPRITEARRLPKPRSRLSDESDGFR